MVCEHGRVGGVCHVLPDKLELLGEDELTLLECLKNVKSQAIIIDIVEL